MPHSSSSCPLHSLFSFLHSSFPPFNSFPFSCFTHFSSSTFLQTYYLFIVYLTTLSQLHCFCSTEYCNKRDKNDE
jgi:hypothetical protein